MAREILDGKLYDTTTASEIASRENGLYRSDFDRTEETLVWTASGQYVIFGAGGARSRHARHRRINLSGGSGSVPSM